MSWLKVEPYSVSKASLITLSMTVSRKGAKPVLNVSFPSTLSGLLGFDAEGVENCEVHMGRAEHAGQMWVKPVKDAGFNLRRLKQAITIRVPVPAGLLLKEQSETLNYTRHESGGFVISLPPWAVPGESEDVNANASPDDRPAALEVRGKVLIFGGREINLTPSQAVCADLLVTNFGKAVDTETMIAELKELEPKSGATPELVRNWVNGVALHLQNNGWPLVLAQGVKGGEWRMRRAMT